MPKSRDEGGTCGRSVHAVLVGHRRVLRELQLRGGLSLPLLRCDPVASSPTEGACEVAFAFHLDRGSFGNMSLDGLNVVVVARTPGPMIEGNWTVALDVDERADGRQREALQAIFSGQAGGTMGAFTPLIFEVLGIEAVPILYRTEGKRRSVENPATMDLAVRPATSAIGEDTDVVAINAHPLVPAGVAFAVGEAGSTWTDYWMRWDNSGRNGHYAAIAWSNE